jgi:bacillithiol system protein YtxJ
MKWKELRSESDWQNAVERSCELPVVIFKHSTRCSVSAMAKRNVESSWEFGEEQAEAYFLDLLAHRDVSSRIADDTGIRHESPQIILLMNKSAVYNASHNYIDTDDLRPYLIQLA